MRTQEVEIKVLDVAEAVRRGEKVEDDLVECKRDWPELSRARQLAGLCNKARGSDVLLIIGLDESNRFGVSAGRDRSSGLILTWSTPRSSRCQWKRRYTVPLDG